MSKRSLFKGLQGLIKYRNDYDLYPKNSLDRNAQIVAIETVYHELLRMQNTPFSNKVKEFNAIEKLLPCNDLTFQK